MKKNFRLIMDYVLIATGALLAGFSVACILIPNDAIDYGTAGIGILINKFTGYSLSLCVIGVFIPFLLAGFVFLGKSFMVKALAGSVVYTVSLEFFEKIPFELNTEHFLAVAFGGAILGAGLSMILRSGGCIDGSEILANIIVSRLYNKTGRNYSMSPILIGFNVCVYSVVFLKLNRNAALLSLLVYIVATAVIDHFTDHFESIKQVTIITKDADAIVNEIKEKLNKTCTIMDSRGAIAGENTTLICYISYFELQALREIISRNKGTFSTVSTIDEILR
ncbi:YitT family protein [Ruminococcus sp. HUN007]|uniref:YitT family protein n=1 Tax=Ruminococcus sp. HUN007 TaxID=1514668 RepID=UPI0005D29C10|nr:YitT family protein [Ruminococcus sp. HUN007]